MAHGKPSFFRQIGEIRDMTQTLHLKIETLKASLERVDTVEYIEIAENLGLGLGDLKDLDTTISHVAKQEQRVRTGRR